jgi:hypothetical protein
MMMIQYIEHSAQEKREYIHFLNVRENTYWPVVSASSFAPYLIGNRDLTMEAFA